MHCKSTAFPVRSACLNIFRGITDISLTDVTMYETLIRQQEIVKDAVPTVEEAVVRLRGIEARKHSRRSIQLEHARVAREAKAKRKAEDLDDSEGVTAEKRMKKNGDRGGAEPSVEANPFFAADSQSTSVLASPAAVASSPEADLVESVNGKITSKDDRRLRYVKPAAQTRGHTSYLTFAFLLPASQPHTETRASAFGEPVVEALNSPGKDSYAVEYSHLPDQELAALVPDL